jgi:hypothetical protein
VDPVPDPLLFFLVVPGIEPGPPDLYPRTLTTEASMYIYIYIYIYIYFLEVLHCIVMSFVNACENYNYICKEQGKDIKNKYTSCEHWEEQIIYIYIFGTDRLCGLVVRVLGYRSGGPGSIPGTTKKK